MNNEEKKKLISEKFKEIMQVLELDVENDDSLRGTPDRVAKMYVDEIFYGLQEDKFPKIMTQENRFKYDEMLIQVDIPVKSMCEHHFIPVIGVAHVAYIPGDKLIGLSKINRIVDYYSRRPQVQEKLVVNIMDKLTEILGTENIAVTIDAKHYCVYMRGVNQESPVTRTSQLSGNFKNNMKTKEEYLNAIGRVKWVK